MISGPLLFYYGATILSLTILGLAVLFGCLKFSSFQKEQRWYLFFLVFILCIELITNILIEIGRENMLVYPFYISGEFFLLSGLFIAGLKMPRGLYIVAGIVSAFLFAEAFHLWMTGRNDASGYGIVVSNLTIICLSGYYLIRALKMFNWEKQNRFLLIYACLFLYYTVSLFLFLLLNQLSTTTVLNASIVWGINNVLSSVLYGASLYTFIKLK